MSTIRRPIEACAEPARCLAAAAPVRAVAVRAAHRGITTCATPHRLMMCFGRGGRGGGGPAAGRAAAGQRRRARRAGHGGADAHRHAVRALPPRRHQPLAGGAVGEPVCRLREVAGIARALLDKLGCSADVLGSFCGCSPAPQSWKLAHTSCRQCLAREVAAAQQLMQCGHAGGCGRCGRCGGDSSTVLLPREGAAIGMRVHQQLIVPRGTFICIHSQCFGV